MTFSVQLLQLPSPHCLSEDRDRTHTSVFGILLVVQVAIHTCLAQDAVVTQKRLHASGPTRRPRIKIRSATRFFEPFVDVEVISTPSK